VRQHLIINVHQTEGYCWRIGLGGLGHWSTFLSLQKHTDILCISKEIL